MKKDDLTLLLPFIHVLTQGGEFETEYELALEKRFLVFLVLRNVKLTCSPFFIRLEQEKLEESLKDH